MVIGRYISVSFTWFSKFFFLQKLTHLNFVLIQYVCLICPSGVIRGTYAQELMSNCQKIISDETDKITDPVQLLHKSAKETNSPGSSTALIAHLDNNVRLGP